MRPHIIICKDYGSITRAVNPLICRSIEDLVSLYSYDFEEGSGLRVLEITHRLVPMSELREVQKGQRELALLRELERIKRELEEIQNR